MLFFIFTILRVIEAFNNIGDGIERCTVYSQIYARAQGLLKHWTIYYTRVRIVQSNSNTTF